MEVVLPPSECLMPLVTCLICRRIPNDPSLTVYLCPAGHLFCLECVGAAANGGTISKGTSKSKLLAGKKCRKLNCPESLQKSVEPMLRDIHLWSLYPCRHNLCKQQVPGQELKGHEDFCHYGPIACPDCRKVVLFEDYLNHLEYTHKIGVDYSFSNDAVQKISIDFPPTDIRGYSVSHYHNFHAESFFIHVVVQKRELFVWVQYYGDIWREQDFSATVCFKGPDGHRTESTAPISPITTTFPAVQQSKNYAHFSLEMLKCYITNQTTQLSTSFSSNSSTSSKDKYKGKAKDKDKDRHSQNNNHININNNNIGEDGDFFAPGLLQFDVVFNYDFLRIFNRSLYHRIVENFGTESSC